MKTSIEPFNTSIFKTDEVNLSNHTELKQLLLKIYSDAPAFKDGNFYGNGFTSYFYDDGLQNIPEFNELCTKILLYANDYIIATNQYMMNYGFKFEPRKLKISRLWFNANKPGAYQGKHHHADHLLGGTYYLDVPDDSGKIAFYNPNPYMYYQNQKQNNPFISDIAVHTRNGDLLIWPGWIDHEISANNTSDKTRLTISFCLDWDESND